MHLPYRLHYPRRPVQYIIRVKPALSEARWRLIPSVIRQRAGEQDKGEVDEVVDLRVHHGRVQRRTSGV